MTQHIAKKEFEVFDATTYRIGIVVGRFNHEITDKLLESAQALCEKYSIPKENVSIHAVAGCVEIPVILKALAEKKCDCLVALGAIIRGDTPHFDYVARLASDGIRDIMMQYGIPVGFGILTCDTVEQARIRTHVGGEAVEAALQSARIIQNLKSAF
jgi:6,7-dimethyl-8-ribityllumazine synthase